VNENELREAMHATLTAVAEPPPMDSAAALTQGRRAVRRRAALAGTGVTAVLAAAAVVGVSVAPTLIGGGRGEGRPAGAPPPAAAPSAAPEAPKKVWPTESGGTPQQDATARSGPRYQQGRKLMQRVLAVVPAGYTAPTGLVGPAGSPKPPPAGSPEAVPLQYHEASIQDRGSWGYLANVAIARDGRTGRLLAEVHTRGNGLPSEPCALARAFWGMGGRCHVTTVGAKKVGVVVEPAADNRLDQWAAYRYPDGTVVYVAQSVNAANMETNLPRLPALPLSVPKLAALAVDPALHLS
jgi:hypothetical protein